MAIERLLTGNIGAQVKELMATEDIVIEAVRDLVKDEIKSYIRQKVDADEELKDELKEAISYYFNAKARSVYAEMKASRAAARLGLRILPDDLQGEVGEALANRWVRAQRAARSGAPLAKKISAIFKAKIVDFPRFC